MARVRAAWNSTCCATRPTRPGADPSNRGRLGAIADPHQRLVLDLLVDGRHAFIDRLEAFLDNVEIPDWDQRYASVGTVYAEAFGDR